MTRGQAVKYLKGVLCALMCKRACLLKSKLAGGNISQEEWDEHNYLWAYYQLMLKKYMYPLVYIPQVVGVDATVTFSFDWSFINANPGIQSISATLQGAPEINYNFVCVSGNTPEQNLISFMQGFNSQNNGHEISIDILSMTFTVKALFGTYSSSNGLPCVLSIAISRTDGQQPVSENTYLQFSGGINPSAEIQDILNEVQSEQFNTFAGAINNHLDICVAQVNKLDNFGSCNNLNII